jgi:glycosyltransferase involved in cell wall biosynthesis
VFYNTNAKRERTIVVASRTEREKGLWLALPYLELFISSGWKVKSFGSYSKTLSQIESVEQLGFLDSQEIAALFNSSSLYLDFSLFEGLGLVPLEAYFCGAIPVLTRKGAPETIFTGDLGSSVIWLDSPTFSEAAANRLIGLSEEEMQEFRQNSNLAAELRNKDKGLDQAAGHIVEYLSKLSVGN